MIINNNNSPSSFLRRQESLFPFASILFSKKSDELPLPLGEGRGEGVSTRLMQVVLREVFASSFITNNITSIELPSPHPSPRGRGGSILVGSLCS